MQQPARPWARNPHPRRSHERILGPALIVAGTVLPALWGWAHLHEPLTSLGAHRALAFVIYGVQLAGCGALGCMTFCLFSDPGSALRWRDRHPTATSTACPVCALPRPLDAHHCRICDLCVVGHDHHCCVLGVCIADGNRLVFIVLLFLGSFCYASMCALSLLTWVWLHESGAARDPALLARTYLPPGLLFLVGALLLGCYCLLQLLCLTFGLRTKQPGVLGLLHARLSYAISHALAGSGAAPPLPPAPAEPSKGAGGPGEEHMAVEGALAEEALAEPGCCVCIEAHHRWGLGGVLPGAVRSPPPPPPDHDATMIRLRPDSDPTHSSQPASHLPLTRSRVMLWRAWRLGAQSLITSQLAAAGGCGGSGAAAAEQRARLIRALAAFAALAEWVTAAYLLRTYGGEGRLAGRGLLLASALLSVHLPRSPPISARCSPPLCSRCAACRRQAEPDRHSSPAPHPSPKTRDPSSTSTLAPLWPGAERAHDGTLPALPPPPQARPRLLPLQRRPLAPALPRLLWRADAARGA